MIAIEAIPLGENIIFYDGICGLCNRFVQFVLHNGGGQEFLFCSLQSAIAAQLLSEYGVDSAQLSTIYVIKDYKLPDSKLLNKSRAVLFILDYCHKPWQYVSLLKLLPSPLLDLAYDFIAGVRYKIFGQDKSCSISDSGIRQRFIDQ